MEFLKLVALDAEDLEIISAHLQDAVMKVGDIVYEPAERRFAIEMNRFVWEGRKRLFSSGGERRRTILHLDRVMSVKRSGLDQARGDDILSLLALRFISGEAPGGTIEMVFSGKAAIRLSVECVEARLTDTGAAWETPSRPSHAG